MDGGIVRLRNQVETEALHRARSGPRAPWDWAERAEPTQAEVPFRILVLCMPHASLHHLVPRAEPCALPR